MLKITCAIPPIFAQCMAVIDGWLGAGAPGLSGQILKGQFDALDLFATQRFQKPG